MDRKEIRVLERPDSISWEEISSVLRQAHADNIKKGIILPYPSLPPEELYAKTEGRGGIMLVALCNGKVVGTGAVVIINKNIWCGSGLYAYCYLDSVLPEYAGQGIYRMIVNWQEDYAKKSGVNRMLFDTHELNRRMLSISQKHGYRKIDYKIRKDHNSILLVKWLNDAPISYIKCALKFAWIRYNKIKNNRVS